MQAAEPAGARVLYAGDVVLLGETRFAPEDARFGRESAAEVWPNIALPRLPVGIRAADARPVLGDANTALLFLVGRPYRRISIGGRGTWTEWIEVRPDVLEEILAAYDAAGSPARPSPFRTGCAPAPQAAYLAHRRMRAGLGKGEAPDPLGLEEAALAIACAVLAAGFDRQGVRPKTARDAERQGRDLVFMVQALLNRDLARPLRLSEVAAAAGLSPYHLCRVFRRRTGLPIHRYRDSLRVRASLERVLDGDARLIDIAYDLGYANEAHFSDAFRRRFGMRPSAFRRRSRCRLASHG